MHEPWPGHDDRTVRPPVEGGERIDPDRVAHHAVVDRPGLVVPLVQSAFDDEAIRDLVAVTHRRPLAGGDERSVFRLRFALLRLLQREDETRGLWQHVVDRMPRVDKDRVVLDLWRAVDVGFLTEDKWPRRHYREHFFEWFLGRYAVVEARSVYTGWGLARQVHWVFGGGLVTAVGVCGAVPELQPLGWLGVVVVWAGSVTVLGAGMLEETRGGGGRQRPPGTWVRPALLGLQTLVPRLGGATAVGLLTLLASADLARWFLVEVSWSATLGLLVLAALYLALEIARKITPHPGWRVLVPRWAAVVVTGAGHASAMALLGAPLLARLLADGRPRPLTFGQLAAAAVYVLTLGLVLHVIWEERPLTRPL